jgi:hypothetical protein
MKKYAFVKRVVIAGGFLILCGVPASGFGQSSPARAAQSRRLKPAAPQPGKSAPAPDFFEGLTLTDEQKAKIEEIRQDTKSRLEAVSKNDTLGPEVKDAMVGGFQRIENSKIYDVLSPEQQRAVRRRASAWKAAQKQNQLAHLHQLQSPPAAPAANSQPK